MNCLLKMNTNARQTPKNSSERCMQQHLNVSTFSNGEIDDGRNSNILTAIAHAICVIQKKEVVLLAIVEDLQNKLGLPESKQSKGWRNLPQNECLQLIANVTCLTLHLYIANMTKGGKLVTNSPSVIISPQGGMQRPETIVAIAAFGHRYELIVSKTASTPRQNLNFVNHFTINKYTNGDHWYHCTNSDEKCTDQKQQSPPNPLNIAPIITPIIAPVIAKPDEKCNVQMQHLAPKMSNGVKQDTKVAPKPSAQATDRHINHENVATREAKYQSQLQEYRKQIAELKDNKEKTRIYIRECTRDLEAAERKLNSNTELPSLLSFIVMEKNARIISTMHDTINQCNDLLCAYDENIRQLQELLPDIVL